MSWLARLLPFVLEAVTEIPNATAEVENVIREIHSKDPDGEKAKKAAEGAATLADIAAKVYTDAQSAAVIAADKPAAG